MGKSLCMSCGHIGYLTYLHNDEHCEKCYSRNTVAWDNSVKEPRKVLVKSELGLLGALEGKEMCLVDTGYDIETKVTYGVVKENALHYCASHKVAMEHIKELPKKGESVIPKGLDFETKVKDTLNEVGDLLMEKNKKYGDSALNPIRVFSKCSTIEQLLVRADDKLSRLRTQHITEDEDVIKDLIGYLTLIKIAMDIQNEDNAK